MVLEQSTGMAVVEHEDVDLKGCVTVPELLLGLTEYIVFHNTEKRAQSLDYSMPDEIYRTARGGGANNVDKFSEREKSRTETAPFRCV